MNLQLVESLIQVIKALSPEERELLKANLNLVPDSTEMLKKIEVTRKNVQEYRDSQEPSPTIEEIIYQVREERLEHLMGVINS